MTRDLKKNPYRPDEQRVADFIHALIVKERVVVKKNFQIDDPIGDIISMVKENRKYVKERTRELEDALLEIAQMAEETVDYLPCLDGPRDDDDDE